MVKFKLKQTELIPQNKGVLDSLNDLHERLIALPIGKVFNKLPAFVNNCVSKKYFLMLSYRMITPAHITFQTNAMVLLFSIFFSFVKFWNEKHGESINHYLSCVGCLNYIIHLPEQGL